LVILQFSRLLHLQAVELALVAQAHLQMPEALVAQAEEAVTLLVAEVQVTLLQ
jgi:hypothetical protein